MNDWQKDLLARPLEFVAVSDDKEHFRIATIDRVFSFHVDAGCCSSSWIEHLEMPEDIRGAVIYAIDEPPMDPWDGHDCGRDISYNEHTCGHAVLQVYHTRFRTTKGDIVLEYRNDSNGYYGGSLVLEDA